MLMIPNLQILVMDWLINIRCNATPSSTKFDTHPSGIHHLSDMLFIVNLSTILITMVSLHLDQAVFKNL